MASARSAWGIDVGNRALKAIKVVRDAAGVRISDFEVVEHENVLSNAGDNRDTLIRNAIANFVQTHPVKRSAVAVGVSGQSSFARFIKLPPVEDKQIPKMVRFEAAQQIPFPLSDVEWSSHLFRDPASPDVEVGIFAMRKELVQEHLRYFADAGIDVDVVQMNPLAVYNAMFHDERLSGATMIIDLGAENTDLIIADGGNVWLRSVPIGGNNFTESLVKSFKLRFEKAEELKRNAATSKYGRQILQAMRPIFADLVAEIQRSIGFYASVHRDSRIARVVALGGTFRLPGLQKYLQQNLQLEVQKIDRLGNTPPADAKVASALNENLLSSVSAYGLALQGVGAAKIDSSLLPETIRREREWKSKTKWFAAAAACIVVGTGLAAGRLYYEGAQFDSKEADKKAVNDLYSQASLLSNKWKAVGDGAKDKTEVADVQSMTRYRDLWERIYGDIVAASAVEGQNSIVPGQPASSTLGAKPLARADRKEIILDEVTPDYKEDLGPILGLDDNGILPYIASAEPQNTGRGQIGRPAFGLPGAAFNERNTPAAQASKGPAGPRGYLITMHCMTPYRQGLELVTETLVSRLNSLANEPVPPPPAGAEGPLPQGAEFHFTKVWIPKAMQLKDNAARVEQIEQRAKESAERRAANAESLRGGLPGAMGGGLRPGGVSPYARPGGASPYARPVIPGLPNFARAGSNQPGTAEDAGPVDPQTGESILNDWDVIVVAAVVLDPKPTAAPGAPPAAPAPVAPAAPATPPASAAPTRGGPIPLPGPGRRGRPRPPGA